MNEQNLRKLRLTVDMLEVRLRQQGVQSISDLQWATIESNGQLGYMLKPEKQYATKEDINMLISLVQTNMDPSLSRLHSTSSNQPSTLFSEIKNNEHKKEPPKHLR